MEKFFYIEKGRKFGPFTKDELKDKNLSRDTKVWFYGLNDWSKLSEIEALKDILHSFPPELKIQNNISSKETKQQSKNRKNKKIKTWAMIALFIISMLFLGYISINKQNEARQYENISSSAYGSDEDFQMYVDKFYRDIGVYGIYPQKPSVSIIKFANLDKLKNTTHIHGRSYGIEDDNRIEIYINPSSWENFNKPMRYYLMYHELAHDILNIEDLNATNENKGKLMYPTMSNYSHMSMDDFIESSHALFEKISHEWN